MNISHIVTGSRGRLAQLLLGVGNNQFVRASDYNKLVDEINALKAVVEAGASISGTFKSADGTAKTITVTKGVITHSSPALS